VCVVGLDNGGDPKNIILLPFDSGTPMSSVSQGGGEGHRVNKINVYMQKKKKKNDY
jgi:hypothetical protein